MHCHDIILDLKVYALSWYHTRYRCD